jgi:hypothetical protein
MIPEHLQRLVGLTYAFDDGNTITIKEIKRGDENYHWITYITVRGNGLPQQYKMEFAEFNNTYGHLFP